MMMIMKKLLYLCLPLVSFVLLTGCIKENMDDCERCKLTFTYLADVNEDVFPNHITSVSLYVFDSKDQLIRTKRLEQNDLKAYQGVNLNLNPGKYRIVGVGNCNELTEVYNTDARDMSQTHFRHPDCFDREVESNDSLYLGAKEITIPEEYWYKDNIRFYSSHLKVSYTVKDYVAVEEAQPSATRAKTPNLELRVKNLLSQTDFNNRAYGEKVTYNPSLKFNSEDGDFYSYFHIMRHAADSDVLFELVDRDIDEVIHTLALSDFLAKFDEIDVTKQEVLIPIEVVFKNLSVEVTIPDWMINDLTPGFGNDNGNEPDEDNNN